MENKTLEKHLREKGYLTPEKNEYKEEPHLQEFSMLNPSVTANTKYCCNQIYGFENKKFS